ncbi:MAG: VWA domain-containing protein [Deltaproteobacteria bacterium]|nr:VWA domain-containing protein [Deltaproteobacteria bacterium]
MSDNKAARLDAGFEHDTISAGGRITTHLVVDIEALASKLETRASLAVAFAIDISGSMQGEPLDHVRESLVRLIDLLGDDDRASLTVFSDSASPVFPLSQMTQDNRASAKRRIRRLESQSSTNIEAGLAMARASLPDRERHERQVVALLSDGVPNVGAASPEALAGLAAGFRPDVSVTTLGYGHHHQEDVLHAIAEGGGGSYVFIPDPEECEVELATAIGAQKDIAIDGVEVVIRPRDGVTLDEVLLASSPRFSPDGMIVRVPDMPEGEKRSVAFKLTMTPPSAPGPWRPVEVELRYRLAGSQNVVSKTLEVELPVSRTAKLSPARNAMVLVARADRVMKEARTIADRGNYDSAAALVRGFMAEVENAPGYVSGDGSPLSETYEQLLDDAVAYETRPSAESYRNYKRSQLGVDLGAGGGHRQFKGASGQSRLYRDAVAGDLPEARLIVEIGPNAGDVIELDKTTITFGRAGDNDLVLSSGQISRRHFRVVGIKGAFTVVDLGSTSGTQVNGRHVSRPWPLRPGDRIQAGEWTIRYEQSS